MLVIRTLPLARERENGAREVHIPDRDPKRIDAANGVRVLRAVRALNAIRKAERYDRVVAGWLVWGTFDGDIVGIAGQLDFLAAGCSVPEVTVGVVIDTQDLNRRQWMGCVRGRLALRDQRP